MEHDISARRRLTAAATVAALTIVFGVGQAAYASEAPVSDSDVAADIAALIEAVTPTGSSPDVISPAPAGDLFVAVEPGRSTVTLPVDPADPITITASDGTSMSIGLPATATTENAVVEPSGTVVYAETEGGGALAAQALDNGGARALVTIPDSSAPDSYTFDLELPPGVEPALQADGSILMTDVDGNIHGGLDAPWAKDAAGIAVPTSYSIQGRTVTQHLELSAESAFPVVADPSGWWGWAKCTAAIGALVAGNLLIATKIRKLGGVAKVVQKLKVARNAQERYKALLYFFGEFAGINAVITNCR